MDQRSEVIVIKEEFKGRVKGRKHSEESKIKISKANKGKVPW